MKSAFGLHILAPSVRYALSYYAATGACAPEPFHSGVNPAPQKQRYPVTSSQAFVFKAGYLLLHNIIEFA